MSNYVCDVTGEASGSVVCPRLSQAAVAGQARRGRQSHRSRSAVRSETESVRVRVSTNLRSKMAAACDLVSGDHGVQ